MMSAENIRVGKYDWKTKTSAYVPGYENIVIHPGHEFGCLSPYDLRTEEGHLIENVWQGSKFYPRTRTTSQYSYIKGHYGKVMTWTQTSEVHEGRDGHPNDAYWSWRDRLFRNEFAVRYPNSYQGKRNVKCSYWPIFSNSKVTIYEELDYVKARKKIYCGEYIRAWNHYLQSDNEVSQAIKTLRKMSKTKKIQIIEVDGPEHNDTHPYDKVLEGEIGDPKVASFKLTEENIIGALENTTRPFGHGYVVATLIAGKEKWLK